MSVPEITSEKEALNHQMTEAVRELRETMKSKVAESSESKEKIAKIEKDLDSFETINQEITKKFVAEENSRKELEKRYEELEKRLCRLPRNGESNELSLEQKSFFELLQHGERRMQPDMVKYLRTDDDSQGGYLAPTDYVAQIIKRITEISPIRSVARVRNTNAPSITIPKRLALPNAAWVGEGANSTPSNESYGVEVIKVDDLRANVELTHQMLTDSAFNIEAEITNDVAESMAQVEGAAFVNGDSINKPEGMLTNADVAQVNSEDASNITFEGMNNIVGELKTGYNPVYMFNRRTLYQNIMNLVGVNGHPLWQPSLIPGAPAMINGFPYVIAEDMPDVAASAYPIIVGDLFMGYTIADGQILRVLRDDWTLGTAGKIRFLFFKRTGGQVVLAEAIKKMVIAA